MPTRFQKMCTEIKNACTRWETFSKKKDHKNYFNHDELQKVVALASVHIILHAGAKQKLIYIGPWKHCRQLQKATKNGRILYLSKLWLWEGDASAQTVFRLLKDRKNTQILSFYCAPEQQHQTALELLHQDLLPRHITISSDDDKQHFYCGNRRVCRILKKKYEGNYYPLDNFWCWEGSACENELLNEIKDAQKQR